MVLGGSLRLRTRVDLEACSWRGSRRLFATGSTGSSRLGQGCNGGAASVESRRARSGAAIVSTATPDRAGSPTGRPVWEWRPVGVRSRRDHDDLAVAGNRLLLALD